jgi:acetyltransferase-like isoleucine patch superfamily enzyme
VHPTTSVMQHATLGSGCIFMARTNVGPYARVGDFVTVNNNSGVAHDAIVEDGVTLSAFCDVTGRCILRRGAFLGSHSALLPGAEVGEFAVVGAGTIVLRRVPAGVTVMGVPAREIC